MEKALRSETNNNSRKKRTSGHLVHAKQNQSYLITTLAPCDDGSLINRRLPRDVLLRIFSYLDIITLCRCAQTCRTWSHLAMDGSNWQRVNLFTFQRQIKANVLDSLARRCGGFLKELNLKGCENIHDSALRSFTAKCPNIEQLQLHKCKRVTDATCDNIGRHCHKLRDLNLYNCTAITDRALRSIAEGCHLLESLTISWCDAVTDRGVQSILQHCPFITSLNLKGCEGLTEMVFEGCEDKLNELTILTMQKCYVTDHTVETIAANAPHLSILNLANCSLITDRSLIALSKGCHELTVLELAACSLLSDSGFVVLAKNCTQLERIDLEDCINISDTTVSCMSNNCPALKHWGLSHCELITDGAITLIVSNQKDIVEVIEMDNCPNITDSGLFQLKGCGNLQKLDLYDCQGITKDGVCRFKSQRPGVEIQAYFAPSTPTVTAQQPSRNPICRCCNIL